MNEQDVNANEEDEKAALVLEKAEALLSALAARRDGSVSLAYVLDAENELRAEVEKP